MKHRKAEEENSRLQNLANMKAVVDRNADKDVIIADLLAACKAILALWDKHGLGNDHNESDPVYYQSRAAIARAEGRG